ncbi:MAG: hypothetical protein HY021_04115 [Burkholderiales bacterium]|nr:hypothetical protein [Burkholderiales bacterium]
MKYVFIVGAILAACTGIPAVIFFGLHVSTGEHVPLARAKALYRWTVVLVLGTFNVWVFHRVVVGIIDIARSR